MGDEITDSQRSYAMSLLTRCGYGTRVTMAWGPLLRKLDATQPGIGTDADAWLSTITRRHASRLIEVLKEEA